MTEKEKKEFIKKYGLKDNIAAEEHEDDIIDFTICFNVQMLIDFGYIDKDSIIVDEYNDTKHGTFWIANEGSDGQPFSWLWILPHKLIRTNTRRKSMGAYDLVSSEGDTIDPKLERLLKKVITPMVDKCYQKVREENLKEMGR